MDRISSRQNPIVKRFRDVLQGHADGAMLLDGEHLIDEALASAMPTEIVAVIEPLAVGRLAPLLTRAQRAGAKVIVVTEQVLAAISPVREPSGIVAIAARPAAEVDAVLERRPQLVLMLHDVQDPGNVGAIVRAAEACGATGVITSEGAADPYGWKALRGAMGSTFRLPVAAKTSLAHAIGRARSKGVRIFATVARDGTLLPHCALRGPVAILFGAEGAGLPQELIDAADERMTIPMHAPVESLNVAVAAALVVYEASRQRDSGHAPRGRQFAEATND